MNEHACTIHEQPTRTCYRNHGCRCDGCRKAEGRAQKIARHRILAGHGDHAVNPQPAYQHVDALLAGGMGRAEIARLAGVTPVSITRLMRGDLKFLRNSTANKLLAVRPKPLEAPQIGKVDATGTRRRLEALACLGWSRREVFQRAGLMQSYRLGEHCYANTRAAVIAVYEQLWNQPAPDSPANAKTRIRASRLGWVPPAAWDDGCGEHGIDNPDATPAGAHIIPLTPVKDRRMALLEDIPELLTQGETAEAICVRVGASADTIAHLLRYHGLHEQAAPFHTLRSHERRTA